MIPTMFLCFLFWFISAQMFFMFLGDWAEGGLSLMPPSGVFSSIFDLVGKLLESLFLLLLQQFLISNLFQQFMIIWKEQFLDNSVDSLQLFVMCIFRDFWFSSDYLCLFNYHLFSFSLLFEHFGCYVAGWFLWRLFSSCRLLRLNGFQLFFFLLFLLSIINLKHFNGFL